MNKLINEVLQDETRFVRKKGEFNMKPEARDAIHSAVEDYIVK